MGTYFNFYFFDYSVPFCPLGSRFFLTDLYMFFISVKHIGPLSYLQPISRICILTTFNPLVISFGYDVEGLNIKSTNKIIFSSGI